MRVGGVGAVNQLRHHAQDVGLVHVEGFGVQAVIGLELAELEGARLVAQFVAQHTERAERAQMLVGSLRISLIELPREQLDERALGIGGVELLVLLPSLWLSLLYEREAVFGVKRILPVILRGVPELPAASEHLVDDVGLKGGLFGIRSHDNRRGYSIFTDLCAWHYCQTHTSGMTHADPVRGLCFGRALVLAKTSAATSLFEGLEVLSTSTQTPPIDMGEHRHMLRPMPPASSVPPAPARRVRLFRNGRNQAIRIPREFELEAEEATMRREGSRLIIEPIDIPRGLCAVLDTLEPLDDEFPDVDDTLAPLDDIEL